MLDCVFKGYPYDKYLWLYYPTFSKGEKLTELLYMKDIKGCYLKEFDAEVLRSDENTNSVELSKTAFYPLGGGQPSDRGTIVWDGGCSIVKEIKKKDGIVHFLDGPIPPVGKKVHCKIDWDLRYGHMKMHTAQHLLSAVIWNKYGASTVGNQIHKDRSHIDFCPASFSMEDLKSVEQEVNDLIGEAHSVKVEEYPRKLVEEKVEKGKVDLSRLPASISSLRVILIGDNGRIDICPCAGTHVANISELGRMKIIKRKSKGSGKIRIEYELA